MAREILHSVIYRLGRLNHLEEGLSAGLKLPESFTYAVPEIGEVRISYDREETFQAIEDKPVLLIANHSAAIPLALLPTLKPRTRDDIAFMADAVFIDHFGPLSRQHMIPIYHEGPSVRDIMSPGTILKTVEPLHLTAQESRRRNRRSIEQGVEVIAKGGMFVMLPTGGEGEDWKAGVGKTVKELLVKGMDFHTISAYISQTRQLDNLRVLSPRLVRRVLGSFHPSVYFSSDLDQFLLKNRDEITRMSPRDIAHALQFVYQRRMF